MDSLYIIRAVFTTPDDFEKGIVMLTTLIPIVKEAGRLFARAHLSRSQIQKKPGTANFVTEYDLSTQRFLKNALSSAVPGASFMGEEDADAHLSDGLCFIVDPIDGTTNFMRSLSCSMVSVALAQEKQVRYAVLYNPYTDELFTAEAGGGAFLNGHPIQVSRRPLGDGIVVFGTAPYYRELTPALFSKLPAVLERCLDLRRSGSSCFDLCNVAAGRTEFFFEMMLSPWDYAAGSLLIREAGGIVTDGAGNLPSLSQNSPLYCGNPAVYAQLAPILGIN